MLSSCATSGCPRHSTLSHSPPGADTQPRPRLPRPACCVSATTAVPAGAPSSASRCSSSCVEAVSRSRTSCGRHAARDASSRISAPSASRYHANGTKLRVETKRMNALSTSSALTNDTTMPTVKIGRSAVVSR